MTSDSMKWIKCSMQLPPPRKNVLICLTNRTLRVAKIHYIRGSDKALYGDYCWYVSENDYDSLSWREVSHWMEIPAKPPCRKGTLDDHIPEIKKMVCL